jgi:steroid 5-alpha reductase family enzyme
MMLVEMALAGLAAILIFMTALWLVSLALKNASIVDIFWGPGFALAAWVYFALTPDGFAVRKVLVVTLVTLWGLRLGLHIGVRNIGKGEDYRYRAWRQSNGPGWWWQSLFKVFGVQGLLMWLITAPLLVAQYHGAPNTLTLWDMLGVIVWLIGFLFEAVGDWQLTRFKADPANQGQVMRTGLWKYTRHPNYFGDAALWWGYFLLALSVPGGWLTIFSPAMMTGLLMKVSGVALLEKNLTKTKPQYQDYIESTNAFFPWFPRQKGG